MEKLEEKQWSIVRQKDASGSEEEGLKNSDQDSKAVGRNVLSPVALHVNVKSCPPNVWHN